MNETLIRLEGNYYEDGSIDLVAYHYPIVKRTKCGVWIELWRGGKRKFVNLECVKKWAHPTMEGAIDSFRRRKQRHLAIVRWQATQCEKQLELLAENAPIRTLML